MVSESTRPAEQQETLTRKAVDENYNNVLSPNRGLAGKLQQLLTPTRHRNSSRRAASVDERRPATNGPSRKSSEQRQSRKSQVAETLLKARERLTNATSEVRNSLIPLVEVPSVQHVPAYRLYQVLVTL